MKWKCVCKGGQKTEKCHLAQKKLIAICTSVFILVSFWRQVETILSILIFAGFKTWLKHKLYILQRGNRSFRWAKGVGFKRFGTLVVVQFQNFIDHRRKLARWLLCFGHFWGVMKIRIAVTLAVLGLLVKYVQYALTYWLLSHLFTITFSVFMGGLQTRKWSAKCLQ